MNRAVLIVARVHAIRTAASAVRAVAIPVAIPVATVALAPAVVAVVVAAAGVVEEIVLEDFCGNRRMIWK